MQHYLAMCLAFRDEAPYLREWLEFHLLVGFEKFYLYDNLSTDQPLDVLRPYIESGIVEYREWDDPRHPHRWGSIELRLDCCARYADEAFWIAFLDADEFIFPVSETDSLSELFQRFEPFPAVGVNWLHFGHGGEDNWRDGLVTERFVKRQKTPPVAQIKTVARPGEVIAAPNPHFFLYHGGRNAVDEHFREIGGAAHALIPPGASRAFTMPASYDLLRINHYQTKSREEFFERKTRKDDPFADAVVYTNEFFAHAERYYNDVEDRMIQRYLPRLRQNLTGQ